MGFRNNFIQWIALLYAYQTAEIWIKGHKSDRFHLERGVWQGCPLFPLLFNITIEMLAIMIWQQEQIEGICVGHLEHKTMLYADDSVFVLRNSVK